MLSCRSVGTPAGRRPPVGMLAAKGICQHLHKQLGLLSGFALILLHACWCEHERRSDLFLVSASYMLQATVKDIRALNRDHMASCQLALLGLLLSGSPCEILSRAGGICFWQSDEHLQRDDLQQRNSAGSLQIAGLIAYALLHASGSCPIQLFECCRSSSVLELTNNCWPLGSLKKELQAKATDPLMIDTMPSGPCCSGLRCCQKFEYRWPL